MPPKGYKTIIQRTDTVALAEKIALEKNSNVSQVYRDALHYYFKNMKGSSASPKADKTKRGEENG